MLSPDDPFLIALTDLGDSAVLGGMTLLIGLYLAATGNRRQALALIVCFLGTAAAIAALKLLFYDCGYQVPPFDIHSPSGHAALATAVWGTLAAITVKQLTGWLRALPILGAILIIASIAVTRVALGFHTADEVWLGLLVGILATLCSLFFLKRTQPRRFSLRGALLVLAAAIIPLHGLRLPAEGFVRMLGDYIHADIPACAKEKLP